MKVLFLIPTCLALIGCDSIVGLKKMPETNMKIRKQVYELTLDDLREHPIWEFALDEESKKGQDEATVRPVVTSAPLDASAGMFIVRGRFTLADGTPLTGYLTPTMDARDLGTIQPQIVTEQGQVGFWMGVVLDDVAPHYKKLGKSAEQTFPISFQSDVSLVGGPIKGSIPAFLHLEDFKSGRVKEIR